MVGHVERRLAALKQRVARLEQQLNARNRGSGTAATRRAEGLNPTKEGQPGAVAVAGGSERVMVQRAEDLFKNLLAMNPPMLISYSEAYRRIIGPYDVWRNTVHAPAVIRIACATAPRRVGQFSIRLDALIVGKGTRRPAPKHFASSGYSESEWIQTFGTWPLLA